MTRGCPFTGCTAAIPAHLFACGRHWRNLTGDERAEIHAAYVGWQRGEVSPEDLRARQSAVVSAVETRLKKGGG